MKEADLRHLKVITAGDLEHALRAGNAAVSVREGAIITPSARDLVNSGRVTLVGAALAAAYATRTVSGADGARHGAEPRPVRAARQPGSPSPEALLNSPEAKAIKEEIIRIGRKLWERQYVDGNGGNISYRLTGDYVLCTPTLVSKADLTLEDFSLVDMTGQQMAGKRSRTSEALLHLEIYRAVPAARAVLHCHPPHATAYAIAGVVPPNCIIPEHEVFVGQVALTSYETPGTKKFAESVLPYVREHNTILLGNHGIVCWADTVTHAEWYAEVVDTYCRTLIIAAHLGVPITRIPGDKTAALLEVKKKLGLPDARFGMRECQLCDQPEFPDAITACPCPARARGPEAAAKNGPEDDTEALIHAITERVIEKLSR
jgi:L-fuculose-phosphate aldolase